MKRGLLLINLGTPDAATEDAVRRYLAEFLMDPLVIDIPFPFRWLLVHGSILRKRPALSAAQYRKVWTARGSPLLTHLNDLVSGVQARLPDWKVVGGMRYGEPSIESAVRRLARAGIEELVALPLYPQWSSAATESSTRELGRVITQLAPGFKLRVLPEFFADPGFLDSFALRIRETLTDFKPDHVLFSYHGLPERQIRRGDPTGHHCLAAGTCCDRVGPESPHCYRAQCFATTRELVARAGLEPAATTTTFQSRLGRTPWIRPYTDHVYADFAKRGAKRLAVVCPAFVADCLETLEEISIRAAEDFRARGGEEIRLVPSLNSSDGWVSAVAKLAQARAH